MPFDGKINEPGRPDLTFPSLEGLHYLLVHPELWPRNFSWEFRTVLVAEYRGRLPCYQGCALGLAYLVWRHHLDTHLTLSFGTGSFFAKGMFQMDPASIDAIFFGVYQCYGDFGTSPIPPRTVGPHAVAQRIREYLDGKRWHAGPHPNDQSRDGIVERVPMRPRQVYSVVDPMPFTVMEVDYEAIERQTLARWGMENRIVNRATLVDIVTA
jgi:hypothetical protein